MQTNKETVHKISLILNVILALAVVVLVLNKMGILTRENLNLTYKPSFKSPYYEARLSTFEMNNSDTDIVFVGDSITDHGLFNEFFVDTKLLNRGIGGDNTEGVYNRMGEILSHHPKKIFIMVGVNDIFANFSQEKSMKYYKNIITNIKNESPSSEIYVQSVLPTKNGNITKKIDLIELNMKIKNYNDSLKVLCDEEGVSYVDLHSLFLKDGHTDEELLCEDGVHLNGKGYERWLVALEDKVLRE